MTPELVFILTYPTYNPTVNFPFDFLNFHSDALLCHLLFSPIIRMHSIAICFICSPIIERPHLLRNRTSRIKYSSLSYCVRSSLATLISPPPKLDVPPAHPCCTSPPTILKMRHRGGDAPLTQIHSSIYTLHPQ